MKQISLEQSVVNVSQVFTVDKVLLNEKIGSLSRQRIQEILAGLGLLITPEEASLSDEENSN